MKIRVAGTASLALIFFLALTQSLFSQFEWSTPLPLTDSLADNRNALVIDIPFNGSFEHYLFWERAVDSTATEIWYRSFYDADDPVALMAAPGVHYRNPQVIRTGTLSDDTLFYFFYQSDEGGDADIYYKVYTPLGFGEAESLAASGLDETHFRCNQQGSMTYLIGDKVVYSRLSVLDSPFIISPPVTVDSGDCSSPELPPAGPWSSTSVLSWLKAEEGNTHVYYSHQSGGAWSDPIMLAEDDWSAASPRFALTGCNADGELGDLLSWDSFDGQHYSILATDFFGGWYVSGFYQGAVFQPMLALYSIPVSRLWQDGFLVFVNAAEGNGDIFVNQDVGSISPVLADYINVSDSPYPEANPVFFNGECDWDYSCDLFLVWESFRGGHWQLYNSMVELWCGGGVEDNARQAGMTLEVSPNPTHGACAVRYTLEHPGPVSFEIIAPNGRRYLIFSDMAHPQGDFSYHLDLDAYFQGDAKAGLYLLRLTNGQECVSSKLMILK